MNQTRPILYFVRCGFVVVISAMILSSSAAQQIPRQETVPKQSLQQSPENKQEQREDLPPALTEYRGRKIAQTMHYLGAPWLVRESRQREEDCTAMLKALYVKPGMIICDMGCGNGFYSLPLAKQTGPQGRVYAVDIQAEMLRLLDERRKQEQLENIEAILGAVIDPKLPAGKLDLILCVDVYHEFSHPEQMLAAMRGALAPGGRLVLVEFRAEDPKVPIKELHKMSKAQVLKELEPNGFKLVKEFDELPWQHMLFFERAELPGEQPRAMP